MKKIILASASPRRKELLAPFCGPYLEIQVSPYNETDEPGLEPEALCLYHARQKAAAVAEGLTSGLVIGADTIVVLGQRVLGKPHTKEKAREMLELISGRWVEVLTGLALIDSAASRELAAVEVTKVKIKELTSRELSAYVDSLEPLDKAGAFAIQGRGALLVEGIEGCYFNVVGLPLFRLNALLSELGCNLLAG